MSAKHTPEPWRVLPEEAKPYIRIRGTRIGVKFKIANVLIEGDFDEQEARGNARRIVAAVNACKGIDTDELERIADTGGMLGPREDLARIAAQRDDLVAAIVRLLTCDIAENKNISGSPGAIAAARATIKSAKGE